MGRKSELEKGILATRAFKKFHRYENIKDIANHYGIYSFEELHKLIKKYSPIKDPSSFYICDLIYVNQLHNKKINRKQSFHAICVNNLEALALFAGYDPAKIFYGEAWFQNRKKKDKNIKRSDFPDNYTKVIDALRQRWQRLFVDRNKLFMDWHKQQSKNFRRAVPLSVEQTLRDLKNKK